MASLGGMQASNGVRFRSHSLLAEQQERIEIQPQETI